MRVIGYSTNGKRAFNKVKNVQVQVQLSLAGSACELKSRQDLLTFIKNITML